VRCLLILLLTGCAGSMTEMESERAVCVGYCTIQKSESEQIIEPLPLP
jgi:hypothetical protein